MLRLIPLFVVSAVAHTAEVTWTYQVPTHDCAGNPITIVEAEAYISPTPIPAADEDCTATVDPVPDVPPVAIAPDSEGRVTMSLPNGEHFIRARAKGNGQWSNLSNQLQIVVAESAKGIPRPVRDTAYDWRCVNPDGTSTNHARQDTAISACQERAAADPGQVYRIEGGVYRVVGE